MKVYNLQVAMLRSLIGRLLPAVWIFLLIFGFYPLPAISGGLPSEGSLLPQFRLDAPSSEQERAYLGIGDVKAFSINQIDAPYTLIEIMSVYCPQCHVQAPLFNKLFYRLKKNGEIAKKVKMMAVAIGANPTEVNYVKKEFRSRIDSGGPFLAFALMFAMSGDDRGYGYEFTRRCSLPHTPTLI